MNEDIRSLLTEINDLKTKLAVIDYFISSFKEQDSKTIQDVEVIKDKLLSLETKVYNSLRELEYSIETKVGKIETQINNIDDNMSELKGNNLLEFTSSMDAKKWSVLITILITILGAVGGIDSLVASTRDNDNREQLLEQIESLIEFADE